MKRIISVSRRTDIPAFYGEWFMKRLEEGFAGCVNPFNNKKYLVSLKNEDVAGFVFWSNNFIPFTDKLKKIKKSGYKFYFNYTINNYPPEFEPGVVSYKLLTDNLKELSIQYSPESINWRYDPIVISDITSFEFHLKNFEIIASSLAGYVERCIISFVSLYEKVKKNFNSILTNNNIKIEEPNNSLKVKLAGELADIASSYGIKMYSCCCDYLIGNKISRASCIDGEIVNKLFLNNEENIYFKPKPTRPGCGCVECIDIGAYNTCAHGCVYCYANMNKKSALEKFKNHDKESAFLGYSSIESKKWLIELANTDTGSEEQLKLF